MRKTRLDASSGPIIVTMPDLGSKEFETIQNAADALGVTLKKMQEYIDVKAIHEAGWQFAFLKKSPYNNTKKSFRLK